MGLGNCSISFAKMGAEIGATMNLYEAFDIWRKVSETEIRRYRCFKAVSSQRYSVQSADFYHMPLDQKQVADLDRQYLELFAEQAPDKRSGSFDSLEAAIAAHDRDFAPNNNIR
jgi:hypothetical protein